MESWLEIIVQVLCIGALLAIIWWKAKPYILFKKRAEKASGSIVNWMQARSKGKIYFYPMIEFRTEDGTPVQFKAEERSEQSPMYPIGTEVTVLYDPKDTEHRKVSYPKRES